MKAWETPHELTSYRPINLQPIIFKVHEKASLRNTPLIGEKKKSVNTKSSIWLQTKAFHDRTNT
jgi:hypothetical protein